MLLMGWGEHGFEAKPGSEGNPLMTRFFHSWPIWGACCWLAALLPASLILTDCSSRPSAAAHAPAEWPANSSLPCDASHWQLLLFVHPHCPCTAATVRAAERLVLNSPEQLDVQVLFWTPADAAADWDQSRLRGMAQSIPGAQLVRDVDGRESARFGVQTSGQVLLYDSHGQLRFSGGITAGRGHEGDSLGRRSITQLLEGKTTAEPVSCVYGCSLVPTEQ